MYDVIVIGAGFAGATIAQCFAKDNKKVLIIEKRSHIGGNMYDYVDENGILVHKYGPHLFHTNNKRVFEYLSNFTEWFKYEHKVLGKINDKLVPIPFNLISLRETFPLNEASELERKLKMKFGVNKKIPILELRKANDNQINKLAEYIYENVFLYYTMKQWGQTPEEIDPNTTSRVPVYISEDCRYFQDKYQFMPKDGYTKLFEQMLSDNNIDIKLNTDAKSCIKIINNKIIYNGTEFTGKVFYTGPIDELCDFKYGMLPYRSLIFETKTIDENNFQPVGTVNYPTKEDRFTRITEYKHIMMKTCNDKKTTIMYEYPCMYKKNLGLIPYYPIINNNNVSLYNKYIGDVEKVNNLYLIGRLATYKYYNMDLVIEEALNLYDSLKEEK